MQSQSKMEMSDDPLPNTNNSPKMYKPNSVIQKLQFGNVHKLDDHKTNQLSNSLRSELFHRHLSDNIIQKSVDPDIMTDNDMIGIDSPTVTRKNSDNSSVFTISPLVQDLSPIFKEKSSGSYSSTGSQSSATSKLYSSNISPIQKQSSPFSNYSSSSCSAKSLQNNQSSPSTTQMNSPGLHVFKTPAREPPSGHTRSKTPKNSIGIIRKVASGFNTPDADTDNKVINPFEEGLVDKLNLPAFSPSTFTVQSTPSTDGRAPKPFRWSIDQIAQLQPADIDDMPHHQDVFISPDRELEERAQRAIDQYFSNHLIAPSPWNSASKPFTLPSTPQMGVMVNVDELKGSIQKELSKKHRSQDVSCQTVLALPVDFDIAKVLEQYMTHKTEDEAAAPSEELSTSSLRRKLFFQGDGNTSFSPVKLSSTNDKKYNESPIVKRQPTPEWERKTPLKTPSSAHFASSPINTTSCKKHAYLRRTSSAEAEFMASPELSPINRRHSGGRELRTSRSSGEFAPMSSLCTSPIQESFSDQDFPPLPSPNMSPIRKELGASYLPDTDDVSDESTPHASNPRSYNSKASQFTLSPQFYTIDACTVSVSPLLTEATATETDAFKMFTAIPENQDYSMTEMETTSDVPLPNSTNQDTGYQTASIQLTSLHTNLTSQFNSLPLKTETSIDPNDLGDSFNYSQSNPSALDIDSDGGEKHGHVEADSLLSDGKCGNRAKNVLELVSNLYPDSLDVSLNPVGSSTPSKSGYIIVKQKLFDNPTDTTKDEQLGSEVALQVLKRAGDDLARYTTTYTETQ